MPFSINLKRLRELARLSQEELGARTGISKSAISMYENGKRFPDEETLALFADFFNVDMNMLLGSQTGSTYYLDPETALLAQELKNRPEFRVMFDSTKDLDPESIKKIVDFIKYQRHLEGLDD